MVGSFSRWQTQHSLHLNPKCGDLPFIAIEASKCILITRRIVHRSCQTTSSPLCLDQFVSLLRLPCLANFRLSSSLVIAAQPSPLLPSTATPESNFQQPFFICCLYHSLAPCHFHLLQGQLFQLWCSFLPSLFPSPFFIKLSNTPGLNLPMHLPLPHVI